MCTSTFTKIGLLVIALGLTVVGCDTYKAAYAVPNGLDITIQGASKDHSRIVVSAAKETFTLDTSESSEHLHWYYDVPEDQSEYVIVQYVYTGQKNSDIRYIHIHRWISKKPVWFGK